MKDKVKILLCNAEYPPFAGGGGIYTHLLAEGIVRVLPNSQVIVYAGTPEESFDGKLRKVGKGLMVFYSRKLWGLDYGKESFLEVVKEFEEITTLFEPDIIHSHHTMECLIGGIVAAKRRIPFVVTIQKAPVPDVIQLKHNPAWTAVYFCYTHMPYQGVIATSNIYKNQALELGAKEPIKRIYYGINLSQFKADPEKRIKTRSRLNISEKEVLILCPSRIDERKGIDVLIESAKEFLHKHENVKVIVAGHRNPKVEDYYNTLTYMINAYDLDSRIQLGVNENIFDRMPELYNAADICVLPSLREGLGISIIEAMSCGVPVISTQTVGVDELVRNDETGILVPPGDPNSLSQAVEELINNKERRAFFANNALNFLKDGNFDYRNMAEQHIDFYKEILLKFKNERS